MRYLPVALPSAINCLSGTRTLVHLFSATEPELNRPACTRFRGTVIYCGACRVHALRRIQWTRLLLRDLAPTPHPALAGSTLREGPGLSGPYLPYSTAHFRAWPFKASRLNRMSGPLHGDILLWRHAPEDATSDMVGNDREHLSLPVPGEPSRYRHSRSLLPFGELVAGLLPHRSQIGGMSRPLRVSAKGFIRRLVLAYTTLSPRHGVGTLR